MGQWRQKFVAIRHLKSGDFEKCVENYQKVAIFGQKMAVLKDFFSETFGLSNFPKLRLNLQKLVTLYSLLWQISAKNQDDQFLIF